MKPRFIKMLAAAGLAAAVSYAGPINFDFETGDFTGWTIVPLRAAETSSVTSNFDGLTIPSGKYFAVLTAGLGRDIPTTASQTFNLNAGDTLSGWAGFKFNDYSPYDDYAMVIISKGGSAVVEWEKNVIDVGDYGDSGWQAWSYQAPTTGSYTITYEVANKLDNLNDSQAYFDGTFVARIPDSTSIVALVGLGLVALIAFRRRWT
jgi:hypothetical protein